MDKGKPIRIALALTLALVLGCGFRAAKKVVAQEQPFMAGMTDEEKKQTPLVMELPNDDGLIIGYVFHTRDLTELESFRMLYAVTKRIKELNADASTEFYFDTTNKVVIFAYEGKTVQVTATADYGSGEVELWTGFQGKDWYVKKTYKGNPDEILDYLTDGAKGHPIVEEGKASEELKRSTGRKVGL